MNILVSRSFATHDGTFHADEVTACALLLVFDMIDYDKIKRTRDPQDLEKADFVCDVGGIYDPHIRRFDHHQATYQGALSSAGMILQYLHDSKVIDEKEFLLFNNALILGVDAHDNGKSPNLPGICTLSHMVSNLNPIRYDAQEKERLKAFFKAVDLIKDHIERLYRRYNYTKSCRSKVEKAMIDHKECLIFDESIPWLENFFELNGEHHPAKFVIMPSGNNWKLRCIPPSIESRMKVRQPLPRKWAGLFDDEFQRITGINGAIFCHKGRFISVWETKDDAIAAYTILKNY